MVYAGSHASSFRQASQDLEEVAELDISEQRTMRATKRIGQERVQQRDAHTGVWTELPLPEQQGSPREQTPQVACVEMDGGRLQIRNRQASEEERQRTKKAGFWREDKVGCLLSMSSEVFQEDPCPEIPQTLVDVARMRKISREIKGFCVPDEEESACDEAVSQRRPGQPEVLVRSVAATRENVHEFGKQLAAAAWQRGFSAAPRKATVTRRMAGVLPVGAMGVEWRGATGDRGRACSSAGIGIAGKGRIGRVAPIQGGRRLAVPGKPAVPHAL